MRFHDHERGATVVVVAMSLLMLLGFAALAIDGGLGLDDRRGTQNAADAAALAAAWEYCNSSGPQTPAQAAIAKAAENGYISNTPDFPQVNVTGSGDTWTVEIIEKNPGVFGGATPFAPDELTIASEATARCFDEGVLGGYALFSETATCGGYDLSVNSSDTDVTGGIHANDDVLIQGSSPTVSEELAYRDDANVDGSLTPTKYYGSPKPYPLDLTIEEYRPGPPAGPRAATAGSDFHDMSGGNITVNSLENHPDGPFGTGSGSDFTIDTAGIYYTDGNVSINKKLILTGDAASRGVTFVAEGTISIHAAENLSGFDPLFTSTGPKLLLFANANDPNAMCNPAVLDISGDTVVWEGVMFAPYGPATIHAAGNSTIEGSILAHALNLSGGSIQIVYADDSGADPVLRVELLS